MMPNLLHIIFLGKFLNAMIAMGFLIHCKILQSNPHECSILTYFLISEYLSGGVVGIL